MTVCTSPSDSPTSSYPGASDGASLIPWLKGLSSSAAAAAAAVGHGPGTASTASSSGLPPLHILHNGASSAPVTPPLSSPTSKPQVKAEWDRMEVLGAMSSGVASAPPGLVSAAGGAVAGKGGGGAGHHHSSQHPHQQQQHHALPPNCPATVFSQMNAWRGHPWLAAAVATDSNPPMAPPYFRVLAAEHGDAGVPSPSDAGEDSPAGSVVGMSISGSGGINNLGQWIGGMRVQTAMSGLAVPTHSSSRLPPGMPTGMAMGLGPFASSRSNSGAETPTATPPPWINSPAASSMAAPSSKPHQQQHHQQQQRVQQQRQGYDSECESERAVVEDDLELTLGTR